MDAFYDLYFKYQDEMICGGGIDSLPTTSGVVGPGGEKLGAQGLYGGHAYTFLKARRVLDTTGAVHKLIQIRYVFKLKLTNNEKGSALKSLRIFSLKIMTYF